MYEREYRELSFVPRWGIVRTINTQSVAEHSYYVALYTADICHVLGLQYLMAEAVTYALWHDVAELFTGDIPGPVKRRIVDYTKLNEFNQEAISKTFPYEESANPGLVVSLESRTIVKLADCMEEVAFLATEINMGNQSVVEYLDDAKGRLQKAIEKLRGVVPIDVEDFNELYGSIWWGVDQHVKGQSTVIRDDK